MESREYVGVATSDMEGLETHKKHVDDSNPHENASAMVRLQLLVMSWWSTNGRMQDIEDSMATLRCSISSSVGFVSNGRELVGGPFMLE